MKLIKTKYINELKFLKTKISNYNRDFLKETFQNKDLDNKLSIKKSILSVKDENGLSLIDYENEHL